MGIEALLSTQIIDTTTVGRAVMTAADAAAARTAIGAGTSSFDGAYSALSGIPSTFAPSAHKTSHATGGSDALTAADIGAAATSHTHAAADITSGTIATARLASGTANSTTYLRGDQTWASVAAGVGGSTGAVDNGVLRADGTGGSTVQSSDWIIADNYTASPNNTVNHGSIQATGGTTNVSVSIVPKGTGAFSLHVPDGTATGGNARGANAIDLQTVRTAATQVASGTASGLFAGRRNTVASSASSSAIIAGDDASISSGNAIAIVASLGGSGSPSGQSALVGCFAATFGGVNQSVVIASQYATCNRSNQLVMGSGIWSVVGDRQTFWLNGGVKTTTNAAVECDFGNGVGNVPVRIDLAAGRQISGMLIVQGIKSDGSVSARYCRLITIRRVSNTTTLDDSSTVGTDLANGTSLSVTADSVNHRLNVSPIGVAGEIWRWQVEFRGLEQAYGT